jgi:hypothetical protein
VIHLKFQRFSFAIILPVLLLIFLKNELAIAADLETRSAVETTPAIVKSDDVLKVLFRNNDSYVQIYGQINKGFISYDDGQSTLGYFPVDNANSSTRFGLKSFHRLDEDWSIGSNLEAQWAPYSAGSVNQNDKHNANWDTAFRLRKAEVYINSEKYGRLWLGQGSMASDGSSEFDLSGTTLAGYASVGEIASGQLLRLSNGILTDINVSDTFTDYDGISRKLRARYDTPDLNGLVFGASVGQQVVPIQSGVTVWDVSAKYKKKHGEFDIVGGLAYFDAGENIYGIDGAVSSLHVPSGINLTFAGAVVSQPGRNGNFFYTKLGHQADYFDFGTTAFSVDALFGNNLNAIASESVSFGFQAVQSVDSWGTEFYLSIRSYDYDDNIDDYKNSLAILVGSRFSF